MYAHTNDTSVGIIDAQPTLELARVLANTSPPRHPRETNSAQWNLPPRNTKRGNWTPINIRELLNRLRGLVELAEPTDAPEGDRDADARDYQDFFFSRQRGSRRIHCWL